jgi:hypothetical protein
MAMALFLASKRISSSGIRVPRLQLLGPAHLELQTSSCGTGIDIHNTHQITEENEVANPGTSQQLQHSPDEHDPQHNVVKTGQSTSEIEDGLLSIVPLIEDIAEQNGSADANSGLVLPLNSAPPISTPSLQHHKRKTRAKTPVVEDEVRRSDRLRRNAYHSYSVGERAQEKKGSCKKHC